MANTGEDEARLLEELTRLRRRVAEMEALEERFRQVEEDLRDVEEKHRTLVEQSLQGLCIIQDFRFVFANSALAEISGYTVEDLKALSPEQVRAMVHPDDQPFVWGRFRDRLEGKPVPPRYEFRVVRKDGTVRWLEMFASLIEYRGKPAVQAMLVDITERKRVEQEGQERWRYLERVLMAAPDAIITLDANHRVVDWNPGAEKLFGYAREEVVGRDVDTLITDSGTSEEAVGFTKAVLTGQNVSPTETVRFRKDGSPVDVILAGSPIVVGGELIGVVALYTDISRRKRAEQEIRQQAQALAALHETALDLAAQQELPDLLQAIVARAVHLLRAKAGGIYLYRPADDDLEQVLTFNLSPDYAGIVLQRGEGLCGKVLESGRPMAVGDYRHWEGRSKQYEGRDFDACVAVPILWGDRLLGIVEALDDAPRTFSSDDISLLERFVPLAAAALEQRRLLEEVRARWREAETLRQAGAVITEVLSLDEMLERILEQLQRVVPHDSASVQLLRAGVLEIVGGRGFPDPEAVRGLTFPVPGRNPNTAVIERREPVILADAQAAHPPFNQPPHDHIRSWLGVPLIVRDRVIGLLAVDSVELGHFDQEHCRLVIPFADQVAAALENARLYSDLQRQMQQLKDAQTQLIQSAKLAAVGELAAGVAHELNNPLTSVLGLAEIMARRLDPGARDREDLEAIVREAQRARDIVRALLDFSRQRSPRRGPADVNQILRQTLALIRQHLEKTGVAIEEEYAPDIGFLSLDEGQMRQVFLNLIGNASHAMPDGGTLTLRTARVGDEVAVSIGDTGEGIAREDLERIFDPFFTTRPDGTGLGLSVSLGIVQAHGGHIAVESEPGQGSTFTVRVPVQAVIRDAEP